MQRVLAIDPGLRKTGYAVVQLADGAFEPTLSEAGVLALDAQKSIPHRLAQLYHDLSALIEEHNPHRVAVENIYAHYKHPRTAILMAHARGVILLCAQQRSLDIENLAATEIKNAITGNGHASKQQMQQAVQRQCRLPQLPEPPDVADAIGIALTSARRLALRRA